jgi:hypothetical protein
MADDAFYAIPQNITTLVDVSCVPDTANICLHLVDSFWKMVGSVVGRFHGPVTRRTCREFGFLLS